MLGLSGAGKTQIAHKICKLKRKDHLPTNLGCNFYEVTIKNTIVKINELGGDANIREIWYHYFLEAYGVIFVIDCSNLQNIDEAKIILHNLFIHPYLEGKCFLIIGNKQDLPNAIDYVDLCYFLNLEVVVNETHNPCRLDVTGLWKPEQIFDSNLDKSILWLIQSIKKRMKIIKNVIKYYNEPIIYRRKDKNRRSSSFFRLKTKKNKCRPSTAPDTFNAFVQENIASFAKEKLFEKVMNVNMIEEQIKSQLQNKERYLNKSLDNGSSMNITEVQVQVHRVDDQVENFKK